jgi:hypothetical protein
MPQPLLHFGNVRVMRQRIGRRGGAQGMYTEAVYIGINAHKGAVGFCRKFSFGAHLGYALPLR